MMTDPIADMLTRIRNASAVRKERVIIPFSRLKQDIVAVLKSEGYIEDFMIDGEGVQKEIVITLKYVGRVPVVRVIKRISKPGCRTYAKAEKVPVVLNNRGIAILSTSQGVMTNKSAKQLRIGGEILCEVS